MTDIQKPGTSPELIATALIPSGADDAAGTGSKKSIAQKNRALDKFVDSLENAAPAELAPLLRLGDSPEQIRDRVRAFFIEQVSNVVDGYAPVVYQAARGPSDGNPDALRSLNPRQWLIAVANLASEPLAKITETTSPKERDQLIQSSVVRFYAGIRDYHVGGFTTNTAYSRLGFRMTSADDGDGRRYYTRFVSPGQLGPTLAAKLEGAEILEIDGVKIDDYVKSLMASGEPRFISQIKTDQVLAELLATVRVGAMGMETPEGSIAVKFKLKDGTETELDMTWLLEGNQNPGPGVRLASNTNAASMVSRQTGEIESPGCLQFKCREPTHDNTPRSRQCAAIIRQADKAKLAGNDAVGFRNIVAQHRGFSMMAPTADRLMKLEDAATTEDRHRLGSARSYLPRIGEVGLEATPDDLFDWYTTKIDGEWVGVVRIATYSVVDPEASVKAFGDIIENFNKLGVKALLIDQVKNPGGSVPYLYSLFSHFSTDRIETPLHMTRVTREDASASRELLQVIANLKQAAEMIPELSETEFAQLLFGETFGGYPVDASFLQKFVNELNHEVKQFESGKGDMTDGFHISGIDYINPQPNRERIWKGPAAMMIDPDTFSGGDFAPEIAKHNGLMEIAGESGARAGGAIRSFASGDRRYGMASHSLTSTLAFWPEPKEGQPRFIEGKPIKVDHEIAPTVKDIADGQYSDMKAKLEAVVKGLLKKS